MNKNVKIAKELIKIAKQLVGINRYENVKPKDLDAVYGMTVDELIGLLMDYIDKLNTLDDYRNKLVKKYQEKAIALGVNPSTNTFDNTKPDKIKKGMQLLLPKFKEIQTSKQYGFYALMDEYERACPKLLAALIRIHDAIQRVEYLQNAGKQYQEIVNKLKQALDNHNPKLNYKTDIGKLPADLSIYDNLKENIDSGNLRIRIGGAIKNIDDNLKASKLFIGFDDGKEHLDENGQVLVFSSHTNFLVGEVAKLTNKMQDNNPAYPTPAQTNSIRTAGFMEKAKNILDKFMKFMTNKLNKFVNYIKSFITNMQPVSQQMERTSINIINDDNEISKLF